MMGVLRVLIALEGQRECVMGISGSVGEGGWVGSLHGVCRGGSNGGDGIVDVVGVRVLAEGVRIDWSAVRIFICSASGQEVKVLILRLLSLI